MISITILDGDDLIKLSDLSVNINGKLVDDNKDLCHMNIIKIIKIIDSWKKQNNLMDEFDDWEIRINFDDDIRVYSSKEYSNYDFNIIREIIDELIRKCL